MAIKRKKKVTKADFIPAGITPFDNGKVKMGIYHQPPKYVENDSDMLMLQSYLIQDPKIINFRYWTRVVYYFLVFFVIAVVILSNKS